MGLQWEEGQIKKLRLEGVQLEVEGE